MAETIQAILSQTAVRLRRGERGDLTLTVQNKGAVIGSYRIALVGVDDRWFALSTDNLYLWPGDQGEIQIALCPPADAPGGAHDLAVQVICQDNPSEQVRVSLALEIEAGPSAPEGALTIAPAAAEPVEAAPLAVEAWPLSPAEPAAEAPPAAEEWLSPPAEPAAEEPPPPAEPAAEARPAAEEWLSPLAEPAEARPPLPAEPVEEARPAAEEWLSPPAEPVEAAPPAAEEWLSPPAEPAAEEPPLLAEPAAEARPAAEAWPSPPAEPVEAAHSAAEAWPPPLAEPAAEAWPPPAEEAWSHPLAEPAAEARPAAEAWLLPPAELAAEEPPLLAEPAVEAWPAQVEPALPEAEPAAYPWSRAGGEAEPPPPAETHPADREWPSPLAEPAEARPAQVEPALPELAPAEFPWSQDAGAAEAGPLPLPAAAAAARAAEIAPPAPVAAVPQALELGLAPPRGSGPGDGAFCVRLINGRSAELTVRLEAADPAGGLFYLFEPFRIAVPAGQARTVALRVRPKAPLPQGEAARVYPFVVSARPAEDPASAGQVQGEWEQRAPGLEVSLRPPRGSGAGDGTFYVHVQNGGSAAAAVRLEASDPEQACWYALDSVQLAVPAGGEASTRLRVRPKVALSGADRRTYFFTVTAQDTANRASRAVQGEWEQLVPTG